MNIKGTQRRCSDHKLNLSIICSHLSYLGGSDRGGLKYIKRKSYSKISEGVIVINDPVDIGLLNVL